MRLCAVCPSVCASFSPDRPRRQNLFFDGVGGGGGSGVCAEVGGRLSTLELFRDGQKPGQWT